MNKQFRMKYEPITVKEPYKEEVRTFKTTDEFTIYYREHESELKGLSTMKLNRTFKIPGYRIRITKKGTDEEELILVKDYYKRSEVEGVEEGKNDIESRMRALEEQVKDLTNEITNISKFLEQMSQ